MNSAVDTVTFKYGRIDILTNNVGIGSAGPLAELTIDRIRKTWENNSLGQLRMVQQVLPHMALCPSGSIVNGGSMTGTVSTPRQGLGLRPCWINVVQVLPVAVHQILEVLICRN